MKKIKSCPKIALLHSETRSYRVPLFDLLQKNYDVVFYFMYGANWSSKYPESKNWNYKNMKQWKGLGYSEDFSPGIIKELLKDYDIIITSGLASFATHSSFLIAKLTGKKIILWDETWEWPKTFSARIAKPYAKYIVKHANACVAAGSKAKEFYKSFGAKKNIFIANNCAIDMKSRPVDENRVEELKKKYALEGKKVVLYLGRIIKYKGLDYLIRAFKEIEDKNPSAFLLIGGPNIKGWENHCKSLAKKIKLKNYRFIGEVPHDLVQEHYALANVFVLPTRFLYEDNVVNESWGLTVNESLSMGIPVVSTTAVAAAYDMIEDGKSGFMVEERSVSELSNAIIKTLDNNAEMSAHARAAFEKWNNYNTMFKGFKKAIEAVYGKRSKR